MCTLSFIMIISGGYGYPGIRYLRLEWYTLCWRPVIIWTGEDINKLMIYFRLEDSQNQTEKYRIFTLIFYSYLSSGSQNGIKQKHDEIDFYYSNHNYKAFLLRLIYNDCILLIVYTCTCTQLSFDLTCLSVKVIWKGRAHGSMEAEYCGVHVVLYKYSIPFTLYPYSNQ